VSPRAIRRIVYVIFLTGVAGIIVGSIQENNGFAITFGVITAFAALILIIVTSVAPPGSLRTSPRQPSAASPGPTDPAPGARRAVFDEAIAADVEVRIEALVEAGADEAEIRRLVRLAIELGRSAHA
jgi:hypothetical protein